MILKPSNVSPNNIAVNAQEQITISWRNLGDRQTKYKIVIYLNLDNTLIYDTGIITTYNTFCVVPANTLINGNTYKYQITVWNANNQSATSDWVIINCSSPPSCALVNIEPEGEILNSSYLFIGEYSQPESVPIKSWMMILYDSEQEIIGRTQEIFNDEIQYEFSGFNTDDDYYIELQVRSQDDLLATTGKIHFTVRYEVPLNYISLVSENIPAHGAIRLSWNTTQIIGEVIEGTISFIDGEKIDLTQGIIRFKEGVPRFTDFNMKVWVDLVNLTNELITQTVATCIGDIDVVSRNGTTELLRMQSNIGDLWLTFQFENDTEGRFHLWHNFLNATYHIHSDIYEPYVYPNCYIGIKYDGTLCDLYIEVGGDE